jgi:hypothetical protein
MTIEEVKEEIKGVLNAKTAEERNQKIDYIIDNVPFDRSRIEEFEADIKELELEAHNLDSHISVSAIEEIIKKYKL